MFFRNLVAKNSRDKSGAGTHKSDKDYDRHDKEYENDALSYVQLTEQIGRLTARAARSDSAFELLRLQKEIDDLLDRRMEL